MKQLLVLLATIFSCLTFGQSKMDTIVINDYQEHAFVHGPGKGKILDSAYYEIANDSIYYNGKGYFKTSERNYIIVKDHTGKTKYEGEYFDRYLNGRYIEYDKMGRKIVEGEYKYQAASYIKIKRKKVYQPAQSIKVGTWTYYGYENYTDKIGFVERTVTIVP